MPVFIVCFFCCFFILCNFFLILWIIFLIIFGMVFVVLFFIVYFLFSPLTVSIDAIYSRRQAICCVAVFASACSDLLYCWLSARIIQILLLKPRRRREACFRCHLDLVSFFCCALAILSACFRFLRCCSYWARSHVMLGLSYPSLVFFSCAHFKAFS